MSGGYFAQDWLLAGDDGEEQFLKQIGEELCLLFN